MLIPRGFKYLLLVLVAFFLMTYFLRYRGLVFHRSTVDQRNYLVRDTVNPQQAADALATINQRMSMLINHLTVDALTKEERIAFGKNVALLRRRYHGNVLEGQLDPAYTSYTVNKGQETVFCLRPRDNDRSFYDLNLLTFVAIHEGAHIASVSEGHTAEFKAVFAFLLDHANRIGIYKKHDFKQKPVEYCGLTIKDSP